MNSIDAELRLLTPAFLGGADAERTTELRVPSIKGQLRFWYRATDPEYQQHESRLFGSTEAGQAGVILSIEQRRVQVQQKGESWFKPALGYLGYGPVLYEKAAKAQVTQRPYLVPGSTFTIRCRFRPWLKPDDMRRIRRAIKAWALFGGLGARVRRGFGSLAVERIRDDWSGPPADLDELMSRCRECLDLTNAITALPEHTAFSSHSVIMLVPIPNNPQDWRQALAWVGTHLSRFRSCYGNKNPRFQPDHDLFYQVIKGIDPGRCPERHVFGLPHNYFTPKMGRCKMEVTAERIAGVGPDGTKRWEAIERRASPFIVRLHRLRDKSFVALFAFLPARVLPEGGRLLMKSDTRYEVRHAPPLQPDWAPITDFLASFNSLKGVCRIP